MSATAPVTTRAPRRTPAPERPVRPVEVAPNREQRRARPRLLAAVATVGGLFVILAAQLLLTIGTSDGAYRIASLQAEQRDLERDEQVLAEQIQVLEAPQHLAAEAQALGMVSGSGSAQLRLSDSAVLGTPSAASASSALVTAADGTPLIPNSLLADVPVTGAEPDPADAAATDPAVDPATAAAVPGVTSPVAASPGAPGDAAADAPIPSTPVGIPTPTTH